MALDQKQKVIRIRYVGVYARLAGSQNEILPLEANTTLHDFINLLASRHGKAFRDELFEDDRLRSTLLLFVNGARVKPSQATHIMLTGGEELVLSPLLAVGG